MNQLTYDELYKACSIKYHSYDELELYYEIYKLANQHMGKYKVSRGTYKLNDKIIELIYFFEICIMIKQKNLNQTKLFAYIVKKADKIHDQISQHHKIVLAKLIKIIFKDMSNDDMLAFGNYMSKKIYYYDDQILKIFDRATTESNMYEIMQPLCNNFALYKRIYNNTIYMHWDTMLLSYGDIKSEHKHLCAILRVMDNLRVLNFFHGDMKCDNIMINIYTCEVQIIDLEYSLILQDEKNIIDWNHVTVNYYDRENECYIDEIVYFGKRILFLYDIYKFSVSLIFDFQMIWSDFKYVYRETYLDFLVISMLVDGDEKEYITSIIDMKHIFRKPCTIEKLREHYEYLKDLCNSEILRDEP